MTRSLLARSRCSLAFWQRRSVADSTPAFVSTSLLWRVVALFGFGLLGFGAGLGMTTVQGQPDSVRTQILEEKGFPPNHSPRGALWRTAAVPGWGQYYNRQYYKIPFVYAGLAGLGFRIVDTNRQYQLFRRAALFQNETDPREQYESEYREAVLEVTGRENADVGANQLRQLRDKFRRQRDLAILGTGLFYALTLLDAYVSAHLLTFDVDDELAVRVHPTGSFAAQSAPSTDGIGMRVQVRF